MTKKPTWDIWYVEETKYPERLPTCKVRTMRYSNRFGNSHTDLQDAIKECDRFNEPIPIPTKRIVYP